MLFHSKTTFVTVNPYERASNLEAEMNSKTTFVTVNLRELRQLTCTSHAIQKQPLLLLIPRF